MGILISTGYNEWRYPDLYPNHKEQPTFDPNYGFPEGRKERVSQLSYEEMMAANIPQEMRNYCAHLWLERMKCFQKNMPILYHCKHEDHEHQQCLFEDMVLRMKEYEREKRLIQRGKRKEKKLAAEGMSEEMPE